MTAITLFASDQLFVIDYRCGYGPSDKPFVESHRRYSISYVRKGSFGCKSHGDFHDLVAGAFMVGYPGDEYMCTHSQYDCGDECLSFQIEPELAESLGGTAKPWRMVSVPPLPELMVLGELAQAGAVGRTDIGLDEIGLSLVFRFMKTISGKDQKTSTASTADHRRAVEAALWIEAHSHETVDLVSTARIVG